MRLRIASTPISSAISNARVVAWFALGTLIMSLVLPAPTNAQQVVRPCGDECELIRQLQKRVEEMEARVKQLEAERARPGAGAPVADGAGAPAVPAAEPSATTPPSASAPSMLEQGPVEADYEFKGGPDLRIRGFMTMGLRGSNRKGDTTSFALGSLDLFLASRLSDTLSVLGDIVFGFDSQNNPTTQLERLTLQYAPSDYFHIMLGRLRTSIGYYNTAYYRGSWFQTTIRRPLIFQSESPSGILPVHLIGASATGRIPSGGLGLHYVAEVSNGRASSTPLATPIQSVVDENNHKAVNFALFAKPARWAGFQAGLSVYRDRLFPARSPAIGETIWAVHAVYVRSNFEWLNEAVVVRHAPDGSARVFHTPGFYSQISRRFGAARPYFRYDYVSAPVNEPMFSVVGLREGPTVGIRYDTNDFTALKMQYSHSTRRALPGFSQLDLQFTFTF